MKFLIQLAASDFYLSQGFLFSNSDSNPGFRQSSLRSNEEIDFLEVSAQTNSGEEGCFSQFMNGIMESLGGGDTSSQNSEQNTPKYKSNEVASNSHEAKAATPEVDDKREKLLHTKDKKGKTFDEAETRNEGPKELMGATQKSQGDIDAAVHDPAPLEKSDLHQEQTVDEASPTDGSPPQVRPQENEEETHTEPHGPSANVSASDNTTETNPSREKKDVQAAVSTELNSEGVDAAKQKENKINEAGELPKNLDAGTTNNGMEEQKDQ